MKNNNLIKKLGYIQLFVFMMMMLSNLSSQSLIHYWNFNQTPPASGINWTSPISDTIGGGSITYSMANAVSFAGTTVNAASGDVVNGGSFCPTGGTTLVNNGTHADISIPTTGYSSISLSYATRRTSSGFTSQEIQYTTDGTNWVSKETIDVSAYTNTWIATQVVTVDFSSITAVNDNANFAVRIIFTGATTEAGNNRIDNIQVLGTSNSTTTYAVDFSVINGNGTLGAKVDNVDIASGDLITSGKNVEFTAVPSVGFRVKEWKLNSNIVSGNTTNSFAISNLQEASVVSVEFEVSPTYAVTFSVVGANGTLAATVDASAIASGDLIYGGKDVVFTATPDATFQVKEWKLNSVAVSGNTSNTYTLTNLQGISDVSVEFELIPAATNGLIISQYIETNSGTSPKGIELWNKTGSAIDFSTTNVYIKQGINGAAPSNVDTINSGTLANNAIIVIGTADLQAITTTNGAAFWEYSFTFNGDDALEIWLGTEKQDVFGTPGNDPGTAWTGSGVSTANQNISLKPGITTGSLTGWSDPSLRFDTVTTLNTTEGFGLAPVVPIYHAVNFNVVGLNGTLSATVNSVDINSGDTIIEGRNVVFTATPSVGFRVKEWKLNTSVVANNTTNNYTISNISAPSVVTVEFEAIPTYAVNFSVVNGNGAIAATVDGTAITSGNLIDAGKDIIFTATPDNGYRVKEWIVNTSIVSGNTSNVDTIHNIQEAKTLTVEFELIPTYAVTFSVVGANGTISANVDAATITSGDLVQAGKNIQFTATPVLGYQVKEWTINTIVDAGNTNTSLDIANIQEAKTVTVEFELIPTYTVTFTVKNSLDVDITDAIITFNGIENGAGNYVFTNVNSGSYTYSVSAPGYLPLNATTLDVTSDVTVPVVLQDLPAPATLPIFYSGSWQTGLPTGWSQTGLGSDYTNAAAKFDNTGDVISVNFDQSPDSLIHTLKANASGTWTGTFDILESVNGVTWTTVASYSSPGSISATATTLRYKLLPDSRWVSWKYTSKGNGNVSLDNVYITIPPVTYPVQYSVVNGNGTVSATVDGVAIASGDQVQQGKNVVFTAVPNTGFRVKEWVNNSTPVAGVTTNEYTFNSIQAATNVTVEFEAIPMYSVTYSVVGTHGTVEATIDGVPVPSGSQIYEGSNILFTATPEAHFRVKQWTNNTVVTGNTANNYLLSGLTMAVTVTVEFEVDDTKIDNQSDVSVNVYPNPSTGIFNLVTDMKYSIEVVDLLGKIVLSQEIQKGQTAINLASFRNGIYFIRFTNESNSYVVKIKKTN